MTPYILVIKNFMTPLFFFKKKIMTAPVYLGPPPIPKKMIAPDKFCHIDFRGKNNVKS